MSRSARVRSARVLKKKALALPSSVYRGLSSLIEGNEEAISAMLEVDFESTAEAVVKLTDCMALNSLSAEALLASYFDREVLSEYCIAHLGKSGRGNAAVLASRINREWIKPGFEPYVESPPCEVASDEDTELTAEGTESTAENTEPTVEVTGSIAENTGSTIEVTGSTAEDTGSTAGDTGPTTENTKPTAKKQKITETKPPPRCHTLAEVLMKHGFNQQPSCKCFNAFASIATGERLVGLDRMLGSTCGKVQEIDTGILWRDADLNMTLAEFMRTCATSAELCTTYFSWCDKAFYTTEFGAQERLLFCYKGAY